MSYTRFAVLMVSLGLFAVVVSAQAPPPPHPAPAAAKEAERISKAATVFAEIMDVPDKAIPRSILDRADGIAVFPSVIRAGFVFGGERGHGIISARTKAGTWSAPAFLTITGGSWGAQIGGEAIDLVLLIMNQHGVSSLLESQFKIGGQASAAAGPVGRAAAADTDVAMRSEILSYSRGRGLFAGITINGASVSEDMDSNQAFYGSRYHSQEIVLKGLGGSPPPVDHWRQTLAKYIGAGAR